MKVDFEVLIKFIGIYFILGFLNIFYHDNIWIEVFLFSSSIFYILFAVRSSIKKNNFIYQKFIDKYNAVNNSSIVVVFDPDGNIIEANNKFCEVFNISESEAFSLNEKNLICETEEGEPFFWQDILDANSVEGEFEMAKPDGEKIWVSAFYSPVRTKDGDVYKVIKIGQDITEDFNNRSHIMQTNIYLEHAGKILRHDMHSGINTYIPRAVKSLERRLDSATIKKLKLGPTLKLLKDGLRHTQKVYSGVKEFTNLVKEGVSIDLENKNLNHILKDYLSLTAYKDQVIINDLVELSVNEPLFCTAIDNFIRNGLKYNDSDTKCVKIYMIDDSTIGIEDNGRGMSKDEFSIFCLPYQRGVNKESGSGLGLNISVAILSEHNFSVDCAKLDKGTLIKVKIK